MSPSPAHRSNESMPCQAQAQTILSFWFGAPDSDLFGCYRKEWFIKSADFDQQIRRQFLTDVEKAAQGEYDHWQSHPDSATALLILLDQFPRNIYRGTPQSFAADEKAISVAQHIVETGWDQTLLPVYRFFVYVPYEHQEAMAYQNQAVALMRKLVDDNPDMDEGLKSGLTFAIRHRDVIERFGRFPHRNAILGRENTAAEQAFLAQPGSRF